MLLRWLQRAYQERPVLVNSCTGWILFSSADVISQHGQRMLERSSNDPHDDTDTEGIDFSRAAKVGALGIVLNGVALHMWYRILDRVFGADAKNWGGILKKCVADQAIYAPLSCGSFLCWAAVLQGGSTEQMKRGAENNLRHSFAKTWLADCMVWPFANIVGFRFVPINYRPTYNSLVVIGWQSYMSSVGHEHAVAVAEDKNHPAKIK